MEHGAPWQSPPRNSQDTGVNMTADSKVSLGGAPVYSAVFDSQLRHHAGELLRPLLRATLTGQRWALPWVKSHSTQTVYALYNGKHYNTGCWFEFGSAEKTPTQVGGSMEAVYHGTAPPCEKGPYAYSDLEHMHEMIWL